MSKTKNFARSDFVSALCGAEAWAISTEWAETLRGWALSPDFDPRAIVTQAGERYGSGMARTTVRDGVGIMQVRGPLFTHENFLTWLFGFDTYESLAYDFEALVNDGNVRGIVMNYHSPGGLVAGGADLAQRIFDARGLKAGGIVARAGGDMSSMAYWLGTSAERVHIAPTGMVGSIGTLVQFAQEEPGTVTIVSDQSPNKRPNMSTEEGRAEVRATLNALSAVFIGDVARNRGVTTEKVEKEFGRGGVRVGAEAVALGMADLVTVFDATFSQVKDSTTPPSMKEPTMHANQAPAASAPVTAPATEPTAPTASAPAAAPAAPPAQDPVQGERDRVSGVLAAFEGTAFSAEAAGFIRDGKTVAEAQAYVLGKLKTTPAASAPAAPGVTRQQLANEGAAAAVASTPSAPSDSDAEGKALRASMTAGATSYRNEHRGGASANRFLPPTTQG